MMSFNPLVHLYPKPSMSLSNITVITKSQLFSLRMLRIYCCCVGGAGLFVFLFCFLKTFLHILLSFPFLKPVTFPVKQNFLMLNPRSLN